MILRFALMGISIFSMTLAGCSNPEYTTRAKDRIAKVKKNVSGEGASGTKKSDASQAANSTAPRTQAAPEEAIPSNKIAVAGMSLDLYAIMDISGSLTGNPGSDRDCARFDALKMFFMTLRNELGQNADARLSLTVFSSSARFIGTDSEFLKLSDSEIDAKYRNIICQSSGNTNAAQAFDITATEAERLLRDSPKKVASVLVFTDGVPNVAPMSETLRKAERLRNLFPERVFGILLGQFELRGSSDFMTDMTGSNERVRRVNNANDITTALISFLR